MAEQHSNSQRAQGIYLHGVGAVEKKNALTIRLRRKKRLRRERRDGENEKIKGHIAVLDQIFRRRNGKASNQLIVQEEWSTFDMAKEELSRALNVFNFHWIPKTDALLSLVRHLILFS